MTSTLRHLANHCQGDDRPDCPIIEGFAGMQGKLEDTLPAGGKKFGLSAL